MKCKKKKNYDKIVCSNCGKEDIFIVFVKNQKPV